MLLKITWNKIFKSRDWAAGMILSSKNERISWNLSLWILDCNDPCRFEFNSTAIGFADMFYFKNLNIEHLSPGFKSVCDQPKRSRFVVSLFRCFVSSNTWLSDVTSDVGACSFCRVGSGCFSLHLSGGLDPSAIGNIFHYLLWTRRKRMEDSIIGIKIHGGAMEEIWPFLEGFTATQLYRLKQVMTSRQVVDAWYAPWTCWWMDLLNIALQRLNFWNFHLSSHTEATNLPTDERCEISV